MTISNEYLVEIFISNFSIFPCYCYHNDLGVKVKSMEVDPHAL